jgi:hypothetical protein
MWSVVTSVLKLLREDPQGLVGHVRRGRVQRALCDAMGAEYDERASYDAEVDFRVAWVREVIQQARIGRPKMRTESWPVVEILMDEELTEPTR